MSMGVRKGSQNGVRREDSGSKARGEASKEVEGQRVVRLSGVCACLGVSRRSNGIGTQGYAQSGVYDRCQVDGGRLLASSLEWGH